MSYAIPHHYLQALMAPRGVALVGATEREGSLGRSVYRNLIDARPQGPLYGVNPKHASIFGRKAYARLADLPEKVDLAVIVTPARIVPQIVREAGAAGIKVLIVDDYAPAADSLAMLLQEMGYHTHVVNDGAAALQAVKSFEPQVALVDIGLPVIDGYEVAQTVRRMPGGDRLPLIAVTGYGQPADRARVAEAGFDEHVVKPLDASRISELIERMVAAT